MASPLWFAAIVHVPLVKKVNAPPVVIVHTLGVNELKTTDTGLAAEATSVGLVPKVWSDGCVKVITWEACPTVKFSRTSAAAL